MAGTGEEKDLMLKAREAMEDGPANANLLAEANKNELARANANVQKLQSGLDKTNEKVQKLNDQQKVTYMDLQNVAQAFLQAIDDLKASTAKSDGERLQALEAHKADAAKAVAGLQEALDAHKADANATAQALRESLEAFKTKTAAATEAFKTNTAVAREAQDQAFASYEAVAAKLAEVLQQDGAVSLADFKLSGYKKAAINKTYSNYNLVVFAMGGFFFSTGLQWSFWMASEADAAERKKFCHHNALCNMVEDEHVDWMGFNPDMVITSVAYLIAGVLIWLATWYHRHRQAKAKISASQVAPKPDKEEAAEPCGFFGRELVGMYFLTGSTIIMEGLLSFLYHTCPSKSFSQFDYIGITTCEVAIFLMMWSKCHPQLPSGGEFAMYISSLGVLSAIEVSLSTTRKPYVWMILWLCIFFLAPPIAVTLHSNREHLCGPVEFCQVLGRLMKKRFVFKRETVLVLLGVSCYTLLQVGSLGMDADWYSRLIIVGMWSGTALVAGAVVCCARRLQPDDKLEKRQKGWRPVRVELEKRQDNSKEHAKRAELEERQEGWRPVRVGLFLMWWFMGFNMCLNGIIFPAGNTLSNGIMKWHGLGVMMYFGYFFAGLLYFRQLEWVKDCGELTILVLCLMAMTASIMLGGVFFVNGSYKAEREVKSYGILCDNGGQPDNSLCTRAANSTLDGDYACGYRAGRYICLVGSLDYNKECELHTLDAHSLWHIFSAIGLLFLPLSVMGIDNIIDEPRWKIAVI